MSIRRNPGLPPHLFTTCDVARIAKNCVNDTDAEPIDVLVCVAKVLGVNYLAVRFQELTGVDLVDKLFNDGTTNFVDERKLGKIKVSNFGRIFVSFRRLLSLSTQFLVAAANFLGVFPYLSAAIELLTGFDFVNIQSKADEDSSKDKENKEICDCEPTGKGNGWENQKRGQDGRFV